MEQRKIIGYKAPISLFNGSVSLNELYVKGLVNGQPTAHYYVPKRLQDNHSCTNAQSIPKEIVETWEPVYEEEKLEIGTWQDYVIIFNPDKGKLTPEIIDKIKKVIE